MILYNHINQKNHFKITVQTKKLNNEIMVKIPKTILAHPFVVAKARLMREIFCGEIMAC